MCDLESMISAGRLIADRGLANVVTHPLGDRRQKSFHLIGVALGDQLHAAVAQVLHIAGHGKPASDALGGVAKAHALHPALIVHTLADHAITRYVYAPFTWTVRDNSGSSPSAACRGASGSSCAPAPSRAETLRR